MSPSLFRRVTRYPVSPAADPAENRLTEVTAGVLEQVPWLGTELPSKLVRLARAHSEGVGRTGAEVTRLGALIDRLAELSPPRVRIATQRSTARGKFVDLELLVRGANWQKGGGVLMWVEVKHGADVHGTQLEDYLADIEAAAASGGDWPVVLLIAPRRAMPKGETPPEVGVVEWEQLARFAAVRAAGIAPTLPQRWILDQYTTYLEEEALLNPPALTAGHAFALSEEGHAHEAMRTICSEANAYVEQHWAPRSNHAKDFGPGYYAHHPKELHDNWTGAWFEWGLRRTTEFQNLDDAGRHGTWAFVAGMTLASNNKRDPMNIPTNSDWIGRRIGGGFFHFWHAGYYRLCRLLRPEELLDRQSAEEQGSRLGEWIVGAFTALGKRST